MKDWKPIKGVVVMVVLGVLSLIFSLVWLAGDGPKSTRLRIPIETKTSSLKDLIKLRSDPSRNSNNNNNANGPPRKKKKTDRQKKTTIRISTEAPMPPPTSVAVENVGADPSRNDQMRHKEPYNKGKPTTKSSKQDKDQQTQSLHQDPAKAIKIKSHNAAHKMHDEGKPTTKSLEQDKSKTTESSHQDLDHDPRETLKSHAVAQQIADAAHRAKAKKDMQQQQVQFEQKLHPPEMKKDVHKAEVKKKEQTSQLPQTAMNKDARNKGETKKDMHVQQVKQRTEPSKGTTKKDTNNNQEKATKDTPVHQVKQKTMKKDKKVQMQLEAEPPEFAMIDKLELATDTPPDDLDRHKDNERPKRWNKTKYGSKPKQPQIPVDSFADVAALVTDRVAKTKLTPQGQIDWSFYEAIDLYHTRKAGGTSLFTWAKKVGRKHGLQVHQQEGSCYDPRDARYINRRVLIFTSLRPPVERALSSYEYDVLQTSRSKNATLRDFFDHANEVNDHGRNERNVWQYKKYVPPSKRIAPQRKRKRKKNSTKVSRGWVWQCATNCYSKWFGGWPTPSLEADTYTAVERLNHLEVVWMKNFDNPDYMKWLLHRWNATDIPLPQQRATAYKAKQQNYTKEELELLINANEKDQWLYEALRRKWSKITNLTLA